jgi:urease gamma subunit
MGRKAWQLLGEILSTLLIYALPDRPQNARDGQTVTELMRFGTTT